MPIDITLPSKRTSKVYQAPVVLHPTSASFLLKQAEERDKIIKEIVANLKYKVGDIVKPYTPHACEKHGSRFRVDRIVDSYAKYGTDTWPPNDKPNIIHAMRLDTNTPYTIFCSAGFLVPIDE